MSIVIKKLTLKNFLSIGNVVQEIDFDNKDLTLILGENLDLGGNDAGSRNGVGKTSMLQALSYVLFGAAINTIKRDNLINRTNEKNMATSIEFAVRGVDYKIIRGRKPNILKFFINNAEQSTTDDDSQGDSRQTQEAIERVLCMSSTMFQHIVGLNSYTTPFLSMKVSDQREVIEQLLGITLLSEKAEAIKELNKKTKEDIQSEEYRIRGVDEANKRIQEQIDNLKRRKNLWVKKHSDDLDKLIEQYTGLIKVDIELELESHRLLTSYTEQVKKKEIFDNLKTRQTAWQQKQARDLLDLQKQYERKNLINIAAELQSHRDLITYNDQVRASADRDLKLTSLRKDITKEKKNWSKLSTEVKTLSEHKCYACGQEFHDDQHSTVLEGKTTCLSESLIQLSELEAQLHALESNPVTLGTKPTPHYRTETEAILHSSELENILEKIVAKNSESDPYAEQLDEAQDVVLGTKPITHYETETQAIEHRSLVSNLEQQIESKSAEVDPYSEQIADMERTGIQVIDYSHVDSLNKVLKHQDYLLDLLTNKKSFVRKKIIEQNLSYLNARLTHYLTKIGLPHSVLFQNDLSVEITELGREMDFHNLSRGEMNRVILALSWAFRDVWESLYAPINLIFIDEILDNGTDASGVENSLNILKDMCRRRGKSVWLVSHKEELINRVPSVLRVIKQNGFTSYADLPAG